MRTIKEDETVIKGKQWQTENRNKRKVWKKYRTQKNKNKKQNWNIRNKKMSTGKWRNKSKQTKKEKKNWMKYEGERTQQDDDD